MPSIDDKVVAMSFESSKFESGVNKTISSLEKLKAALHFPDAGKGLLAVGQAAHHVDLGHISKGVDGISAKLGALRLAAVAVFADIARKAVASGVAFTKAFTIEPIKAGFAEYATNLNAIQTILANTQAAGTNLKDVNAALKELNEYSDKTIYNFSQMARNIGTFTAAGVDLKTATGAIKGIANLAALSGSNSEQAATAMYQLSQAISAGSVKLMDWNSVVNAGMGGTVFQRALAQTAEKVGTLDKGAVKLTGAMKNVSINGEAFRQSLSVPGKASWLTSKVLTQTLKQFTGDLTDAELAAQGFSKAEIINIQKMAQTAMHAATEVKTLSQVFEVAKETAGSGWAATFQIIFGTFTEAKKTFTELSNTINGFINTNADARNKVLQDWKDLGGRTVLINGIKTAFHNLSMVVKPIKQAFRDIFPAVTGKNLYDLTVRFKEFTEMLKPTPTTIDNLRRTFRGLFAVLDIAKMIVGGLLSVIGKLFGAVGEGSGGFLNLTGNIGDFLVSVDQALKKGNRLGKFFDKLGDIIAIPIKALGALKDALVGAFGGADTGGLAAKLSPVQRILATINELWGKILVRMGEAGKIIAPLVEAYAGFMKEVGVAIVKALSNMNFDAVLQVVRTGLFAGIFLMFKKFLGKGSLLDQFSKGFAGGIMSNISQSFGALSGSMKALQGTMVGLQQNIKAKTLKEIAIAIALIAISVLAISLVDPKRLSSSLSAITVMFGQLLGAMAILGKVTATQGFIKMPVITTSLIALAIAIDILSLAVIALSKLSWNELLKGLGGVGALLTGITVAAGPLGASSAGMVRAGVAMMPIAIALRIMANAVKAFGELDLPTLAKGLGAVAVSLGIMVKAMGAMPKGLIFAGAGIILLATGLRILANVVEKFGGMSLTTIAKGVLAVAASLVVIALAMKIMPKGMILQAAGLLLVAVALQGIVRAVGIMGGMSMESLAKGLIGLALSLTILGIAMAAMSGMIVGAASLTIAAAGISLLAGALSTMGGMSWTSILKSMIVLASALTLIGVAGALITPVIPSLLGLGVALLLIGAGLALAGAGIALIGAGLSALVVAAPSGFGILLAAVIEFQQGIIQTAKNLVLGLLEIVKAFADIAPQFVDSLVKILDSIIEAVMQIVPKLVPLADVIINALVVALQHNQDKLIKAALDLVIALLQGIRNSISEIARLAVEIVAELVRGIANNISKIINAGVKLVTAFLKGIANGYAGITKAGISIITKFLAAIANNIGRIVTAGLNIVTKLLSAIARSLGRFIKAGADVIVAFINGIGNAGPRIIAAATNTIIKFINALSKNSVKLANAGMQAIVNFLNGIATAINTHAPAMRAAGIRVGIAIVDGMTFGLASKGRELLAKVGDLVQKAKDKLKVWKSPPEAYGKYIGQQVVLGLANGLSDHTKAVDAASAMSNGVIDTFKNIFQITSPSKVMHEIGREVGQGFANGIRGSTDDIRRAFTDMNNKLADEMRNTRATISAEQAKLREERAKKPKERDRGEIRAARAAIAQGQADLVRMIAGQTTLNKGLKKNRADLLEQTRAYAKLAERIKGAKDALEEATKKRDEAIQGFKDQYGALPDIVKEDAEGQPVDQLATYTTALQNQIAAERSYKATLEQLRKLGLDDKTYEKLLDEGVVDQAFADQLLAGGKTAVDSLNTLDSQLDTVSKNLAVNAGNNLYQAGVDAAQGFLNGLEAESDAMDKSMEKLAKKMIRALKKALKIKSPSEEFAEIGKFSMEGIAKGFSDASQNVSDAIEDASQDALDAMRKSMREISDVVTDEINPNPVITPVLDLTQVKSKAAELAALTAAGSYGQASAISSAQSAAQAEQIAAAVGGTSVKFEQNNYSPEALSDIEIYRQTRNQLSQLKSALALT